MKQPGKEVAKEEGISKDQRPNGHPFKTDPNSSYAYDLRNGECLIDVHFPLYGQFWGEMFEFDRLYLIFKVPFDHLQKEKTTNND